MPFLIARFEDAAEEPETAKRLPNGLMYELQRFLRHGAISTSGNYHNVGKGNSVYAGRFRHRLPLPGGRATGVQPKQLRL